MDVTQNLPSVYNDTGAACMVAVAMCPLRVVGSALIVFVLTMS